MFGDKVFIFNNEIDIKPISNNEDLPVLKFGWKYLLDIKNTITVHEIDGIRDNYAYLINGYIYHQYPTLSHVECIKKFIPDQVITLLRENRCVLILNDTFEGFCDEAYFKKTYDVIDYFSLLPGQFIYATASAGAPEINNLYCKIFNKQAPMEVKSVPAFYYGMKYYGYESSPTKTKIIKKFICLNNRLRLHRIVFGTRLYFRKHLLNETFFSLPDIDIEQSGSRFETIFGGCKDLITKTDPGLFSSDNSENIYSMINALPLKLDSEHEPTIDPINAPINEFYDQSLFNIITETAYYDSVVWGHPTLFLTEKIFKPMMYLQIPIVLGGPGLVQEMRNLGFDMFDDIVDHSYDSIYDHDDRMDAVLEQVEKINAKYTIEEVNELASRMQDRLNSNRNKLLS